MAIEHSLMSRIQPLVLDNVIDAFNRLQAAENSACELECIEPLCHKLQCLYVDTSGYWLVGIEFGNTGDTITKYAHILEMSDMTYRLRWI